MEKLTKSQKWFVSNVVDDVKENLEIGNLANEILHKRFSIGLTNPYTTMTIYSSILETACEVLKDMQDTHDEYSINIANHFIIGYTNTNNDDDEKSGNYMIYIRHLDNPKPDDDIDEEECDTLTLCTQWNAANITTQPEIIKEISIRAKKKLSEIIDIKFASAEFIMPMFCTIYNNIIAYIKLKRVETKETSYQLTITGMYTVIVQETDDGDEEIYYKPEVALKLLLKNDASATGSSEED